MRKNQRPYTYVGLGGVENGNMVGVGWVWVLHTYYTQSSKIVNFMFHRVQPRGKGFSV